MAAPVTLVLGGARAGKSGYALALLGGGLFVATAEAGDAEMAERIAVHRAERGQAWMTIEEPLDLALVLRRHADEARAILVDCLTLWLSNLMHRDRDIDAATDELLAALDARAGQTVLVANEVGLGIVPDNPLARRFRDAQGMLNRRVAQRADRVVFMAAGLPMMLKGA
ncbi:MAG: bifunctional adenosylcobinamide kinase/adenosylcobinamide-phosphate guanylyltransferase [Alphaproteobacteria bacterium]|nr:bifunctional adenosylcobinamide kinase/adenosylcobinamide-phosphate guanylyltransferase [Alphaproteobacteria bacterium]MCW5740952.1 bifunctional adenosylcobinamide kinase/adenosylcobinamide-phosphate guanylyltransferase [Alphaproteobacteria bacterium]